MKINLMNLTMIMMSWMNMIMKWRKKFRRPILSRNLNPPLKKREKVKIRRNLSRCVVKERNIMRKINKNQCDK
jgi:hypothetical protein